MSKVFLYLDILGFSQLVDSKSDKIEKIFSAINELHVYKDNEFQTIVFSDTILIFNKKDNQSHHFYVTYLIEYTQQLFYKLASLNVFFRGILSVGDFNYIELNNFNAYYGIVLNRSYQSEKELKGFGLYVHKSLCSEVITFDTISIDENYHYVLLCQSLINLYKQTSGELPVDCDLFSKTDSFCRIDDDLRFLREINYLRKNIEVEKIKEKYEFVFQIYKSYLPKFFVVFEKEGFIPMGLNPNYIGNIDPYSIFEKQ